LNKLNKLKLIKKVQKRSKYAVANKYLKINDQKRAIK